MELSICSPSVAIILPTWGGGSQEYIVVLGYETGKLAQVTAEMRR